MKTKSLASALILAALAGPASAEPAKIDPAPGEAKVQIALLLDTSNSMDGLIEQTKSQPELPQRIMGPRRCNA